VVIQVGHIDELLHEQRVGAQLERAVKCGLRSNLRQIRPIVDLDRPGRRPIEARDQCVASTVGSVTRGCAASSLLLPSAHASTIFARSASACADFARRAHRVS
jgi:hypothetical protein